MIERGSKGKPDTFDFLGFTHYCSSSRNGKFRVKRKTSKKKYSSKLKFYNKWLKKVKNQLTAQEIMYKTKIMLTGYFRYYGVTDNLRMMQNFKYEIIKMLYKWLNRRSQRKSLTKEKMRMLIKYNPLPYPKIYVNIMA